MSELTPIIINYQPAPPRISRFAIVLFIASIISALGFFFFIPAVLVFIISLIARERLAARTDVGGIGLARAAVRVSATASLIGLLFLVLTPSLCGCGGAKSYRAVCGANLRGISQSMIVYAADNNDQLPIVTFAPYNSTLNAAAGTSTGTSDPAAALHTYFATGTPQAGSPQAALWMLVIAGQVSPKQFICKSDSYITTTVKTTDTAGNYYNNFPSTTQLSYSIAYPWNADGTPAPFWKNNTDATLPILADMTPKQGTGTPARNLTPARLPADNKTWNSANHQGDGQNVAFADGHVDFTRSPNIGHNNDNIYTTSANPSTGPTEFGGIPAGISPPNLTADKAPYDILMLPIRDQTTGKM